MNKKYTTIERVLGKVDNDFNPDTSDWIPRCAAWCIDAMHQLKVLRVSRIKRELEVNDRLAHHPCDISDGDIKVFDVNFCEIPRLRDNRCCVPASTGGQITIQMTDPATVGRRTNITNPVITVDTSLERGFIVTKNGVIQLNFDTDTIFVESLEVYTEWSDTYQTSVPVVPNNGKLIEYLALYCMYKFLARGNKHQVFNLTSQLPTNPYLQMKTMEAEVKASITISNQRTDELFNGWNNFMYNGTFLPRG